VVAGPVSTLPQLLQLEDGAQYQVRVVLDEGFTTSVAFANCNLFPGATEVPLHLDRQLPRTNWHRILLWIVLPAGVLALVIAVGTVRRLQRSKRRIQEALEASQQLAATVVGHWDPQGESLLPTNMQVGDYRVVSKIGAGGMAAVYRVVDSEGGVFALKIPHLDLLSDPDTLVRFEREIKICVTLTHAHVVRTFDAGTYVTNQGMTVPYMVMEMVQGTQLDDTMRLRRHSGAEPDFALARQVTKGVLEGLAFAHERGITHRDVKPSNVMVTDRGVVKIMDFGIAHLNSARTLTPTGYILGTPAYMSPEQLNGAGYSDERSDLYAVGVMLYELLTWSLPYPPTPDDPLAGLLGKLHGPPQPPDAVNPKVPPDLNELAMSLLEGRKDDRCQSAKEALVRLQGERPETEKLNVKGWEPPPPANVRPKP
jgi:serine/threonine protein kinase